MKGSDRLRVLVLGPLAFALIACPCVSRAGAETPPRTADALPAIVSIRVYKAQRRMELIDAQGHVHVIEGLQLGSVPVGPKRFQGDHKTPEGHYTIDWGNSKSAYHLSLHISYPDARDRTRAAAAGRSPGGMIMIHGQPNGWPDAEHGNRVAGDWTDGCIAVSDPQIEALWNAVPDGTSIDILP